MVLWDGPRRPWTFSSGTATWYPPLTDLQGRENSGSDGITVVRRSHSFPPEPRPRHANHKPRFAFRLSKAPICRLFCTHRQISVQSHDADSSAKAIRCRVLHLSRVDSVGMR